VAGGGVKGLLAPVLLAVAACSAAWLASGSDRLDAVLPGGLPVGNAVAALGLASAAAVPVLLSARGTALRSMARAALAGAAAWLPASIALAGNPALNFTGWRGSVWLGFSCLVVVAVSAALCWALAGRLFAARGRTGAT
jgi:hypothetical protein